MTTIWPAYEGSESTSWYPVMHVLITTSPVAWVACPPHSPNRVKPSSRTRTIGSGMLHHALGHHLAATDGHDDPSAQSPTLERRVLAAALEGRGVDRPLFLGINQYPFVVQRLADDLSRPGYAGTVDDSTIEAESENDPDGRLEAIEAARARLLRRPLMRCVVGGDHVDHPIHQRPAEGLSIIGGSQRWIDIAVGTHRPHVLLRQRQVVPRDVGRYAQPLRLRGANQLDGTARAHVLDVQPSAGEVAEGFESVRD